MKRKFFFLCVAMIFCASTMRAWDLVTDASTLQVGDQVVIACNSKSVTAGDISSTYMASVSSTFSSDKSSITSLGSGTMELTLGGKSGAWTFANSDGELLGVSAVKSVGWDSGETTWTISIASNGDATITSTTSTYGSFQYNTNSPRFTTYTSSQAAVQLYTGTPAVSYYLTYQGYPYRTTSCDDPEYPAGSTVKLSTGAPTKAGKTFTGWLYDGVVYQPGANFTMPEEDVVLVPTWDGEASAINNATVTINAKKVLRDGQLLIIKNGVVFNAQGVRVQ